MKKYYSCFKRKHSKETLYSLVTPLFSASEKSVSNTEKITFNALFQQHEVRVLLLSKVSFRTLFAY